MLNTPNVSSVSRVSRDHSGRSLTRPGYRYYGTPNIELGTGVLNLMTEKWANREDHVVAKQPKVKLERILQTVDAHCEGEATRVVVGGVLDVPGATMLERKQHLERERDELRQQL